MKSVVDSIACSPKVIDHGNPAEGRDYFWCSEIAVCDRKFVLLTVTQNTESVVRKDDRFRAAMIAI